MLENAYPKHLRLRSVFDFKFLMKESQRLKVGSVIGYYKIGRTGASNTRIGISISKKVGGAVLRNRVKRKIREFFRVSEYKNLGVDILFVILSFDTDSSNSEGGILNSVDAIFKRIKK